MAEQDIKIKTCPVCKGKGKILVPNKKDLKGTAVKILYGQGFTIREIQEVLGLASPSSVQFHIHKIQNDG